MTRQIYVMHENDEWNAPLRDAFGAQGLPYEEWFVAEGQRSLDMPPPEGVFYNRMSASSHTRGHRFAPELTAVVLAWLEGHGRRVINDSRALQLEVSKAAQYAALNASGIRTPRTVAAVGEEHVLEAVRSFGGKPVILKPNRGGSGRGVQLFDGVAAVQEAAHRGAIERSLDGVTLVQEYVRSPDQSITRVEFVGGALLYAVRVETGGSFELCPADPCAVGPEDGAGAGRGPRFTITDDVEAGLVHRYGAFLAANGIEIGALEFVCDSEGRSYTYDVNTNTNYNSSAESGATRRGMDEIARFLGEELAGRRRRAA